MSAQLDDTICAIATPVGEGGIGIVRISGPDSQRLTSKIITLRRGIALQTMKTHHLYLADVGIPISDSESSSDRVDMKQIDEALVVCMRAPRSYTGEDVFEIHCHGGPFVLTTVCEALIQHGARLAEPGEFTRRAFLHGRLDLTQAEAVLDTIRATTSMSLQLAQEQLTGVLAETVERIREQVIRVLAHLEAGLDFVEEDITFLEQDELKETLQLVHDDIATLLKTAEQGRIIREGVSTAIIGRPNAGKSSLLNALLQTHRAIVSSSPGTTRDIVEEVLNVNGILLRLRDTAGIREASDEVEEEGIRRSEEAREQAELLLIVLDASQNLSQEDIKLLQDSAHKKRVLVLNKTDLPVKIHEQDMERCLEGMMLDNSIPHQTVVVSVSAKTHQGLDRLRENITHILIQNKREARDSFLITRLRHKQALLAAQEAIANSLLAIEQEFSSDCVAVDLRASLQYLGEITGSTSTDDILDRVFSEFCIGK